MAHRQIHSRWSFARRRLLIVGALLSGGLAFAQTSAAQPKLPDLSPVGYRLSFPQASHHYVEIEADVPTNGESEMLLFLPVWTPGSYMVREYARNLEGLEITDSDGKPCEVLKVTKNRWKVQTHLGQALHLRYRVYCHEMTVRNCWVESDFALLNGAALYLSVVGSYERPYTVSLRLPPQWKESFSGMPTLPKDVNEYRANDYDQLIDCPILAGNPSVYRFKVRGTEHILLNEGEGPSSEGVSTGQKVWNGPQSARDVARIVEAAYQIWGDFPYAHVDPRTYTFFNILTQPGGGLEHKDCTVMMESRWATRLHKDYLGWLGLVAHEYFHCWNVKRLRPIALGPFDYENENYTSSLWVAEGFTDYYSGLLVRRAGLSTLTEYLDSLSHNVEALQTLPGRKVQPLSSSSFDAWIKFYRPDENSANTGISYYSKGVLVGFLLDSKIREWTAGKKSLDDVMRLAYQRYSGARGYTDQQFRATASEVAGHSLADFFNRAVDSTQELDYREALKFYGLRFKADKGDPAGKNDPDPGFLDAISANKNGRLEVTGVRRETPAYDAGLQVGDEIVAIDDYRVTQEELDDRLKRYPAGTSVSLLVARREQLLRLPVTLGKKPSQPWKLEVDPAASSQARQHLELWLGKAAGASPRADT